MLPTLSPNLLLILALLLKHKSVSTTAVMVGMSQPSVSRHLARLRVALGDPLLVRTGGQMIRTKRGDELVGKLSEWVASTSSLLVGATFDPAAVERRFRIASTDFGTMAVLLPALADLRQVAPGIAIDVVPLNHAAHTALAQGEIDFAISGLDHHPVQLHRERLFRDRFVCVTRPGHVLASAVDEPVSIDEFVKHRHLGLTVSNAELDRVSSALGTRANDRRVALSVPYFGIATELLLAGDLVMVVPSRAVPRLNGANEVVTRPAPEALGDLDYWLLWHDRSHRDEASTWLRGRLRAACAHDLD